MSASRVPGVSIVRGPIAGAIGRITELHAVHYAAHWGFGSTFEARVATELAEFVSRYDPSRDGIWTASLDSRIEGSIAIDARHAADAGAHLRWFIVSDRLRGRGVGGALLERALAHCRVRGYGRLFLWTFEGLEPARHLYEKAGFALVEQRRGTHWGTEVNEQRFELGCTQPPAVAG